MVSPLDRVRESAGVIATPADSPPARPLTGRVGIGDALAARRGATTEIRALRTPALVAGILALLSAFLYAPASTWAIEQSYEENLFVYYWMANVVTVGGIHSWGPFLAGMSVGAIAGAAAWTGGIADAEAPAIVLLTVGGLGAVTACVPLIIATVIGLVALVVTIVAAIVLGIAMVIVLFMFLGAMLDV